MKKIFPGIGLMVLLLGGCSTAVELTNPLPPTQKSTETATQTEAITGTKEAIKPIATEPPQTALPAPTQTPTQTPPQIGKTPLTQTYRNLSNNFQFDYPTQFGFVGPSYANLEEKIVQLELPAEIFPKTNFGDAGFAVSVVSTKSEKECLSVNLPEGSEGFNESKMINGTKFYLTTGGGAGAGNYYESKTYRTFIFPMCFEINEIVHTTNIGNYDPGTVTEINKDKIWVTLENILSTFKFTATNN